MLFITKKPDDCAARWRRYWVTDGYLILSTDRPLVSSPLFVVHNKKAPPPAWKFVGGRSGSGTTRPRARPRAECSTDSRCRSKPVVMAPQCKPRNGRAPSTPRVSSSSPQVRPAAVVPPRSVSSGKQLRGRIPGLRNLQHAVLQILSTIASARAPLWGALHTASHMCGTRV